MSHSGNMNGKAEHRNDAVQVVKKNGKGKEIQTELSLLQCNVGECEGSYQRKTSKGNCHWTYDRLKEDVLVDKSQVISWLMERKLICNSRLCPQCDSKMRLVECDG